MHTTQILYNLNVNNAKEIGNLQFLSSVGGIFLVNFNFSAPKVPRCRFAPLSSRYSSSQEKLKFPQKYLPSYRVRFDFMITRRVDILVRYGVELLRRRRKN